jgi:hypothetical protein
VNWEEKFMAINALSQASLRMRHPGDWYVEQSIEIGGDGLLTSVFGNGGTPSEAVDDHWIKITSIQYSKYLVVGHGEQRRHYRWQYCLWKEVPQAAKSESRVSA